MREQILSEIRRIAAESGGQPPGRQRFETTTGIKAATWYGVFWAKWGDVLTEAGFTANKYAEKTGADVLLEKLAEACLHYKKIPSGGQLRLYGRQRTGFPSHCAFTNGFSSKEDMISQLAQWIKKNPAFDDVAAMLPSSQAADQPRTAPTKSDGYVYLIQSGGFYKIGRSDEIERRVKEIKIALPDVAKLVHTIRTDDPPGIEAYWHRRFQDRRANGEWFKLLSVDVAAFKRRRYQ